MDDKQKSRKYFDGHSRTFVTRNGYWNYDYRLTSRILDTDDKDKAARYEHLGMKLDRVRSCGEQFHMYDLIREYKERQ